MSFGQAMIANKENMHKLFLKCTISCHKNAILATTNSIIIGNDLYLVSLLLYLVMLCFFVSRK
jgi:hypothetical protein